MKSIPRAVVKRTKWMVGLVLLILPLLLSAQRPNQPLPERGPEPILETPAPPPGNDQPGQMTKALPADRKAEYVPGQVLVRFRPGVPKDWVKIAHGVVRAKVLAEYSMIENLQLVRIPPELSVEDAVKLYQRQPEVLYAEPDYIQYAILEPNDPRYVDGTQWAMKNTGQSGGVADADIDADLAWNTTTGNGGTLPTDGNAVHVVVIDSGIDFDHPDLAANMAQLESNCSDGLDNDGNGRIDDCRGLDAVNNDSNPMDDNNHGSHVAGTIGAVGNNNTGVVGVNWNVRLVACKFLNASGSGATSAAITCLNYVADLKQNRGKNIVATNNSWGGGGFSQSLMDAIETQKDRDILFVAAAGNETTENNTLPHFPSNYYLPNIISVASTTRTDAISTFSNFGRQTVHLGGPGTSIISTTCQSVTPPSGACTHTFSTFSGTSMATPHVTGVAALLEAADPSRGYKKIKNLLQAGANPTPAMNRVTATGGRLNANDALNCSNSVVLGRVRPIGHPISASLGVPVTLAALHINCADPNGNVNVTVNPGGQVITLLDDGQGVDDESNDGIYSGQWTPSINAMTTLTFPGGDVVLAHLSPTTYASSQPAFNYRNIAGTNLNLVDDSVAKITPPFPIQFGGTSFPELFASSNGKITLSGPFDSFLNFSMPDIGAQVLIAPFWDDLVASGANNVFFEVTGSAPSRELVVEWRNVARFGCSTSTARFQVVFFENSSNVLFNYQDVFFGGSCTFADRGGSATVGVQIIPIGGFATQFSVNSQTLNNSMALLWSLQGDNPVPSLGSLVPNSATAGGPAFTLTVNGSNFVNGSVVRWNGANRTTTFVNSNQVTASIPASDIAAPGSANVTVFNPAPGGGTSNTLSFSIVNPVPAITSLQPDTLPATGPQFTLTVNGTGFVNGAVVRWNGSDRMTAFINSTKLEAIIPASDIAVTGSAGVRVFNPPPGGGLSNTATFNISLRNPLPTITGLSPAGVLQNSGAFNLMVIGSNFVFNSTVRFNGSDRVTTFVNGNQLQAAILAGDITTVGTKSITVFSPGPGGGTSNTASFPVQATPNLGPTTSSLMPASQTAGAIRDTLMVQVFGSNFVPGSVVRWNGSNRLTMFNSPMQLTATIPASDLVGVGTAQVTVFTPVPGGGTSNSQTFTINNPPPTLSALSPTSVPAGEPGLILTVTGSKFVPGSVVRWNGVDKPTLFIGNSQLRATIPASDLAAMGSANVTVFTPSPGGGTSTTQVFTIAP